jgi:allantoin racemase
MKRRHLRIIIPLQLDEGLREYCKRIYREHLPHTELSASFLLESVKSTVSDYDQIHNAPWILKAVQAAIRDGCDGVFIDIAFDTALSAAKSLSEIPVVGALESAVALARNLCQRFSIIAINDEEVPVDQRISREYGFAERLVSVEPIHIGVLELRKDPAHTLDVMTEASRRAAAKGAGALILGCTAMSWAARDLAARSPIPVLDTNLIGLYTLDALVALGLRQSKVEFLLPSGLVPLSDDDYARHQRVTFSIRGD